MAKPQIIAAGIVALLIILMTIILLATSLKKLSSDQIGLTYDTINKNLGDEVKREGLHNGPPGFEFIIFPSVYKTISFSDLKCLNKDGVIITLDVTYQFKAQPTKLHDLIINFKDYDGYKKVLEYTGESALHESCSYFNTSQFQAERGKFQERVSNIERPSEYEDAIRSKERAREDIEVARNERPRLVTEAMTEFLEANTTSQIIRDKAESDKRILQARAEQEAKAIIEQYQKESEAYAQILDPNGLGFTVDGFIAYMGVRVISSAQNPVYIGLQSPAKSSYMTP
ncbi:hypothetical protein MAR_013272 [Mya arenaria]|uniref:Band 7 domain-containing protein n=1 Tax=Mya arenaria TaxID=6604 RepID=A0ABY7FZD6_MYAAR|nr:hypothetical protein MAR_013272 [Mya arenaria]